MGLASGAGWEGGVEVSGEKDTPLGEALFVVGGPSGVESAGVNCWVNMVPYVIQAQSHGLVCSAMRMRKVPGVVG